MFVLLLFSFSAEREGFEPPVVLPTTVFKTAAIDRSAISPGAKVTFFSNGKTNFSCFGIFFVTLCHVPAIKISF